ncbi:hypothetical protein [Pseudomonas amygdali]|uniref:Transmembrane protein n=1 Tax=Pseudomonas amygdali pv. lachrymans str. M301315 TaxID=629260 RepID=A0AAD0PWY3_PSEAV|nr:hypothetical protein [Pseudomonas amygdali]AXH60258.1 hypothetical protein PLA107_034290 [Pseudomonas amygdali pv. lachrymans str. M301315]
MSLWCECLDCGGSGEAFICENGLLRAQIMAAKAEQNSQAVSVAMGFMGVFLISVMAFWATASSPSNSQLGASQAAKEFTARMTDDF